jgi:hypothetical protein
MFLTLELAEPIENALIAMHLKFNSNEVNNPFSNLKPGILLQTNDSVQNKLARCAI